MLDQDGFTNFSNGHSAQRYYASDGYVTTGSIDLRLRPGTYYIVFNNGGRCLRTKWSQLRSMQNFDFGTTNRSNQLRHRKQVCHFSTIGFHLQSTRTLLTGLNDAVKTLYSDAL